MERFIIVIFTLILCLIQCHGEAETVLSSVLTPDNNLIRQERSYYERYGYGRPYDRLDDRPSRCGRCDDDDDDDDDDYDRGRDRDDDRRSNRPTYGNRHDRNRNDNDDRRYDNDRNSNKNGTDDDGDNKKRPHDDDKDRDRHSSKRNKHKNRYDDRDRYRPDYYDRFLRDPYRDRYDDPYSRRPYDRYPYDRYDDYGRYDQFAYSGYRRPYYEDRYDRGTAYEDSFGGYGPGVGRGPHDSFRPWDETYRGQAGWDAGGRGYYFASGRPDASYSYGQREYTRPVSYTGGQNYGYSTGYRDPGYQASGYRSGYQDGNGYGYGQSSYGQSSGWRNVGAQRPYRDQRQRVCRRSNDHPDYDGVANLDKKRPPQENRYPNRPIYDQKQAGYGQNQASYGQIITYQPGSYVQSSTTQATSYLFQRNDDIVTQPETTVPPS